MTEPKVPSDTDEPLDTATEQAIAATVSEAVKPDSEAGAAGEVPAAAGPHALTLLLLRHADAGDPTAWTADDAERPLSKKGRRQAKRLARHLKDLDVKPDSILTSPKVRAHATARIVGRALGRKPVADDRLTIDFGAEALAALVGGLETDAATVMLVGHDPDFSDAAAWLVGAPIAMKKGALAAIELPEREAAAGRGLLRWLLPPDAVAG